MKISTLDDDYDLNEREEKEDVNEWENGDGTIKNNIREGKKALKLCFITTLWHVMLVEISALTTKTMASKVKSFKQQKLDP